MQLAPRLAQSRASQRPAHTETRPPRRGVLRARRSLLTGHHSVLQQC